MPIQSAWDGEGIAIFNTPQLTLFEWPARRFFAQAPPPPPPKKKTILSPDPVPEPPAPPQQIPVEGIWSGAFVLTLDLSWLREEEALSVSALLRMTSGGEPLPLFTTNLSADPNRPVWQSRPIYSLYGCVITATQTKGATDIRLPWWVAQLDAPRQENGFIFN